MITNTNDKHSQRPASPRSGFTPILTLTGWQVRQTWRLLFISALGMIAAVVLVCSVPLYSQVALSAGLRSLMSSKSTGSSILITSAQTSIQIGTNMSNNLDQLNQTMQQDLAPYIHDTPERVIQVGGPIDRFNQSFPGSPIVQSDKETFESKDIPLSATNPPQIQLLGYDSTNIASAINMVDGTLPQHADNQRIDIALEKSAAQCLYRDNGQCHIAKVGDEIKVISPYYTTTYTTSSNVKPDIPTTFTTSSNVKLKSDIPKTFIAWTFYITGIFTQKQSESDFWHQHTFSNEATIIPDPKITPFPEVPEKQLSKALVGNDEILPVLSRLSQASPRNNTDFGTSKTYSGVATNAILISSYYGFNLDHIQVDSLPDIITGLQNMESDLHLNNTSINVLSASDPLEILQQYSSRLALAALPTDLLLIVIVGMVLIFISITMTLLVERQSDVIAVLRSRGASRRQIFSVFTVQSLFLAFLVLIIGPLLAIPATILLFHTLFTSSDLGALSLITANPLEAAWSVRFYALIALAATLLVSLLTLLRATALDVMALRRESSRPSRASFWQRFHLDALLALVALAGYGYTVYALNTGVLDPTTTIELLSPMIMISSVLFLLAVLLVFLRIFPRLAQWAAHLASRRKSAEPMLALAQIARTPQQAQRIILLLTLTTALTIFALVFSATQSQRIVDVVNYQVGADVSGWVTQPPDNAINNDKSNTPPASLTQQEATYQKIPGVASATLGTITTAKVQTTQLNIQAVNSRSFAESAIWSPQYSTTSLTTLMRMLRDKQKLGLEKQQLPAIVDALTWQTLGLTRGSIFKINWNNVQINCIALAQVQTIPTLKTDTGSLTTTSQSLLVDFDTFNALLQDSASPLAPNYLWLRLKPGASSLEARATLKKNLQNHTMLQDRQTLIAAQQQDPVTLNLIGALFIGAITPLLLAILGSLLISWLNTRKRLLSFSVLRALGSSPQQIVGMLSWEHSFIYMFMLFLGILAGAILSAMVLPSLVLSSVVITDSDGSFTSSPSLQASLPALRMILPPTLFLMLGLLVLVFIVALTMMIRMIARPSLSQVLRLNAD